MISSLAASFDCQKYIELSTVDDAFALLAKNEPREWCFQLKYDGIWCKIVIDDGLASLYSKTGQLKHTVRTEARLWATGETILVGEFMYGSQWAKHPDREGKVYVFDCLVEDGRDISALPYMVRKAVANAIVRDLGDIFESTALYTVTKLGEIWQQLEKSMEYEGIILRSGTAVYASLLYKLKTEVEDDYVVNDATEGEGKHAGRLGSMELCQFQSDGILRYVMEVGGGFTDAQREQLWVEYLHGGLVNKVCRVKGKSRFASGALRHPVFVQFRDDKRPEDCVLRTL